MPDFSYEIVHGRDAGKIICGVDEVGRGPLAGPVVAAAVILPQDFPLTISGEIKDSKKMSAKAREDLFEPLIQNCRYAIAEASVAEIDTLNILWASMLAMERAVSLLGTLDVALIDGNRAPKTACAAVPLIKGDDKSLSIAAASIIAKVQRDRLMKKLAEEFPHYGWDLNAGYGTSQHLAALVEHGLTHWHRGSFAPVAKQRNQQFK
jgi:ribonuclease HII